jgi:bifunctional DNA-binding transcriptional regulator/antitoxin component of YhaV-PrlF toxin-antitoxin module
MGILIIFWGKKLNMEIKKVDSQGRISLPADWRREVLGDSEEVYVFREGKSLILRPRREPDLVQHFDSVTVDVETEAFEDYHKLKRALLKVD